MWFEVKDKPTKDFREYVIWLARHEGVFEARGVGTATTSNIAHEKIWLNSGKDIEGVRTHSIGLSKPDIFPFKFVNLRIKE